MRIACNDEKTRLERQKSVQSTHPQGELGDG